MARPCLQRHRAHPQNLNAGGDPAKRILLDQLPKILRGYGKTPGIDAVVVVLDSDRRNCVEFLTELKTLAAGCNPAPNTLFRIAIEEMEAWYFGDQQALTAAYPRTKPAPVQGRVRSPPSQRGPNPLQHWGERAKKNQPRTVGFFECWWWILTANGTGYLHACRYVPIEVGISRLDRGHMREPLTFSLR